MERKHSDGLNRAVQAEHGLDCMEETFVDEEILIPTNTRKVEREIFPHEAAVKTAEVNRRITSTSSTKKQKHSARNRLMIGNREFNRNRLKAYGLNPKRLFFRQLGKRKRQEREAEKQSCQHQGSITKRK